MLQLSGDPSGGVVALVLDRDTYTGGLKVFGPTGGGGGLIPAFAPFAIHPNGPLYYVHQTNNAPAEPTFTLIGLDIGLGGGPGAPLAGTPGYPTVLADGSVVVPSVLDADHFRLTFVRPTGAVETQTVTVPNGALWYPDRAVPNGQGGLLVQMRPSRMAVVAAVLAPIVRAARFQTRRLRQGPAPLSGAVIVVSCTHRTRSGAAVVRPSRVRERRQGVSERHQGSPGSKVWGHGLRGHQAPAGGTRA